MENFREIERKFFIVGESYLEAVEVLRNSLDKSETKFSEIEGNGRDYFWRRNSYTFVRVRKFTDDADYAGELTTKIKDKGDIVDRFESNIRLHTDADLSNAMAMQRALFGEHSQSLWKKYTIFKIGTDTNVCIYRTGELGIPLILEVESSSRTIVEALSRFCESIFKLKRTGKSLLELVEEVNGKVERAE